MAQWHMYLALADRHWLTGVCHICKIYGTDMAHFTYMAQMKKARRSGLVVH
jgi:hypothetical protein